MAKNNDSMNAFVPDMTSNAIRAKFDLFRYTLPEREIKEDLNRKRFNSFITEFTDAIKESAKYETNGDKLKLFYAHGMASLYHNLGDVYGAAEDRKVFGSESIDLKEKRREAHEESLKWGEKVDDKYRQLQSKNQLCRCYGDEMQKYEKDLLNGNWIRGKQFVLQRIMRRTIDKSKDINDLINNGILYDENNKTITIKGGLKIGKDEADKIVALNNYNVIKEAINAGYNVINVIKEAINVEKLLTLSDIADDKINLAEKLRDDAFLLYRRSAINLIHDDIFYKINQFWEERNYKECINWSEDYNCRGLIELSRISLLGKLEISNGLREEIDKLKEPIFEQDLNSLKQRAHERLLSLSIESNEKNTELLYAYERVLEKPFKELRQQITDKNIYGKLKKKLEEIYQEQGQETAVIRFWTLENENLVRAVLITRNRIQKHWQVKLDVEGTVKDINEINKELQHHIVGETSKQGQQEDYNYLFKKMAPFSKELKLYEELSNIKNLFIIPDGKLFQLPLHLLGREGHDLREDSSINIYYCPTLNHLLSSPTGNYEAVSKESNYLWVCPTLNLYKKDGENMPELSMLDIEENGKNNVVLKYSTATLKSFFNAFESNNKFTHIGFSTHGLFHDNSKDAYVSHILLSDSFLTPYDVLFSLDLTGIQTVFLGACEVGSSQYTDENEAIGLVTSFLAKNTVSVIAPLWRIGYYTYNLFIETLNKSNIVNSPEPWNLTDIFRQCERHYILSPFVQYANIEIVERRIDK